MSLKFEKVNFLENDLTEKIENVIAPAVDVKPVMPDALPVEGLNDEEKPKKRGRPKGTVKKTVKKTDELKPFDPDAELEEIRKQFESAPVEDMQVIVNSAEPITKEQIQLINGYMLLIMCDVIFPFVIGYIFKKRLLNSGKQRKDLKLTPAEKKELEPLADAAAREISLNMSATQTFAVTMLFVYADKID